MILHIAVITLSLVTAFCCGLTLGQSRDFIIGEWEEAEDDIGGIQADDPPEG